MRFHKVTFLKAVFLFFVTWLAFLIILVIHQDTIRIESKRKIISQQVKWPIIMNQTILDLRKTIQAITKNEKVLNANQFRRNFTYVIVIQVHNRKRHLQHLIESLLRVPEMEETLLIFSHDFYCKNINKIIARIKFARYMQLFYPFPMQLYPNEFPGDNPNDCGVNNDAVGCENANFKDTYEHYRSANHSQLKHHWWWKCNYVFNYLGILKGFKDTPEMQKTDTLLYLTSSLSVFRPLPTILEIFDRKTNVKSVFNLHFQADIQAQFSEDQIVDYYYQAYSTPYIDFMQWSTLLNVGMSFNRTVWQKIRNCTNVFCDYDDTNWDFSLEYTVNYCLKYLDTMVLRTTRIFHLGNCGFHYHKTRTCNETQNLNVAKRIIQEAEYKLFPHVLNYGFVGLHHSQQEFEPSGGWGDPRDRKLCYLVEKIKDSDNIYVLLNGE